MKSVTLLFTFLFTLTSFSQQIIVYDTKPLPSNITRAYVDGSVNRHKLDFKISDDDVKIYVNGYYATSEKIKPLLAYCEQLIDFTEPKKSLVILTDDTKGKNSTMIGRINDKLDVISIRVVTKENQVLSLVMSVERLKAIRAGLESKI